MNLKVEMKGAAFTEYFSVLFLIIFLYGMYL